MKTTITAGEKLQLIGLLTLAQKHDRMMKDIERSMCEVLGADETNGRSDHVSDAMYGYPLHGDDLTANLDELLERVEVKVEEQS